MTRLAESWDRVRSSFWFLPSILVALAIGLAFAALAVDETMAGRWLRASGWIFSGSAEGASTVLGTIAGSMITLAGVVFSLTLIALTLASSQFGPRLLRNFMRDTGNQAVLGTFVATFLYALLVLRAIRREDAGSFVPHLSVSIGVLLALISVGVLIYFIHHVAVAIQADEIVARVSAELLQGIERLFPEHLGRDGLRRDDEAARLPEAFDREAQPVAAAGNGYLQRIDPDALLRLAVRADLRLRVERRPGRYVAAGTPLVSVWPGSRANEKLAAEINRAFVLGTFRTPAQDIEFAISQLVEIAVRALSPSVNDPFTPIACLDRLASAFCRLVQRQMPSPYRRDAEDRLRVLAPAVAFPDLVDAGFDEIRRAARANAAVTFRLLECLALIGRPARRPGDRPALRRQAEMIIRGARASLPEEEDRRAAESRYRHVLEALGETAGS